MPIRKRTTLWFLCLLFAVTLQARDRAAWMQQAQWGVMNHYLADWQAQTDDLDMTLSLWNRMIDDFNVKGLADQLESVGVGYYLIIPGQNSGYYLVPNAAYDRFVGIQPSHCARRDLIADLYEVLHPRGIRLMVYLPSGAPAVTWDVPIGPNGLMTTKFIEQLKAVGQALGRIKSDSSNTNDSRIFSNRTP